MFVRKEDLKIQVRSWGRSKGMQIMSWFTIGLLIGAMCGASVAYAMFGIMKMASDPHDH